MATGRLLSAQFDSEQASLTIELQVQIARVPDALNVTEVCQVGERFQSITCPTLGSLTAGGDLGGHFVGRTLIGFSPLEIMMDSTGLVDGVLRAELQGSLFGNVVATATATGTEETDEQGGRILRLQGNLSLPDGTMAAFSDSGVIAPDGQSITFNLLGTLSLQEEEEFPGGPEDFGGGIEGPGPLPPGGQPGGPIPRDGRFPPGPGGPGGGPGRGPGRQPNQNIGPPPFAIIDQGLLVVTEPERFPLTNDCRLDEQGIVLCPVDLIFLDPLSFLPQPYGNFFPPDAGFTVRAPQELGLALRVPEGFGLLQMGPKPRRLPEIPRLATLECPDVPFLITEELFVYISEPDHFSPPAGVRVRNDGFLGAERGSFFTIEEVFGQLGEAVVNLFGERLVGLQAEEPDGLLRFTDRRPRPQPRREEQRCPAVMSDGFIAVLDLNEFGPLPEGISADERGFLVASNPNAFFRVEELLPEACRDRRFLGPTIGFIADPEFGGRLRGTDRPFVPAPERAEPPFRNANGFIVITRPGEVPLPAGLSLDANGFVLAQEPNFFIRFEELIPPRFATLRERFFGPTIGFIADPEFGLRMRGTDQEPIQGPQRVEPPFQNVDGFLVLTRPDEVPLPPGLSLDEQGFVRAQQPNFFIRFEEIIPQQYLSFRERFFGPSVGFFADENSGNALRSTDRPPRQGPAPTPTGPRQPEPIPGGGPGPSSGPGPSTGPGPEQPQPSDGTSGVVQLSLFLIPENIVMQVGDSRSLQVFGSLRLDDPRRDLTGFSMEWSSKDPEIASVDGSGNIRAEAPGETVIRARVPANSIEEGQVELVGEARVTVEGERTTIIEGEPREATLLAGPRIEFAVLSVDAERVAESAARRSEKTTVTQGDHRNRGMAVSSASDEMRLRAILEGAVRYRNLASWCGVPDVALRIDCAEGGR
ncbi:MAG: hypothetical protein HYY96_06560 [Candidatus Tectomicrobia bacterium]|nr:hypothetical protein [Candidatus Tectomicrobia bacterium]